jgi:hypothetical protein
VLEILLRGRVEGATESSLLLLNHLNSGSF